MRRPTTWQLYDSYHDDQGECVHVVQVAEIKVHVVDQASLMVTTELVDVCAPVTVVPYTLTLSHFRKQ